ncbi:hypothetical protein Zmor_018325 [Zophobas morio]|uniref:Carboxylic ester hydrolase n=1 Tax=Zophobas morio TaxID=2755281 RepID=A0AA38IBH3_9CUCU|nr:hypothetical protein Zmor_018325 [Zophobas morio]
MTTTTHFQRAPNVVSTVRFSGARYQPKEICGSAEPDDSGPPVPITIWSGVYDATNDGPACPQPPNPGITFPTSEDCLYLNVYTPKLPSKQEKVKLPVIIYLHGGGFIIGTARSDVFGPQFLLDEDIVLVVVNYRLATFGFISVNENVPGNNGLKDQVVAMKWTKKYISAFGGDPNSITLFGFSAGSCSANLHLVSPMSRNLFNKAIISSCSVLGPLPLPSHQLDLARKQARLVGCPDDNPEEILSCLRTKSADEIVNTFPQFNEFANNPTLIWLPVIEKDYGQKRFLTEHPIKSVVKHRFQDVPILSGIVKDEFADNAAVIINNPSLLKELDDNFDKWGPVIFMYERGTNRSKEISRQVRKFYLGDGPLNNASLHGLENAFMDALIGFATNRLVGLFSLYGRRKVYYYEFTYHELNNTDLVMHGTDQLYLFYTPALAAVYPSLPNLNVSNKMVHLWSNFAKFGNPNGAGDNNGIVDWKPYNRVTKKYLDIGDNFVLRNNLRQERYAFWRKLYPIDIRLKH